VPGSLAAQTAPHRAIVVDNGSVDGSVALVRRDHPEVELVLLEHNQGFAGGVNRGIEAALAGGAELVALLNNDAVADEQWLQHLVEAAQATPAAGIVGAKLLSWDRRHLDSTGDCWSVWGLGYPRGRGELDDGQYDHERELFAASGGASLYRGAMLQAVGTFDEDFFAYFEDVDLSFRPSWPAGAWCSRRRRASTTASAAPASGCRTSRASTCCATWSSWWSRTCRGRCCGACLPRFLLLYSAMLLSGVARGHARVTLRAAAAAARMLPVMLRRRRQVQGTATADLTRLTALLDPGLPPGQQALGRLLRLARRARSLTPSSGR
jgi:hypothetical protein